MSFFLTLMIVLTLECLLTFLWLGYIWNFLKIRRMRALCCFALGLIGFSIGWFFISRIGYLPKLRVFTALGMLWSLLAVPFLVTPSLFFLVMKKVWHKMRQKPSSVRKEHAKILSSPYAQTGGFNATRRHFLTTSLATAPVIATYGAAALGIAQVWNFRRRKLDVPVPQLPLALVGLRIAHVSDTHIGGFTPSENLDAVAKAVAKEKPELILFTGDLVDYSNKELPIALAFLEKLRAIAPLYLCEGNHDCIDDANELKRQLLAHGFDWLTQGDARTLTLRGQKIQVLGASWSFERKQYAKVIQQAQKNLDASAFPILLVHHPDAFDIGAQAGFPLVLSGHTHGGQLMLGETLGAGSVMFNYWSGLYRKETSSLVVSNGVGHWFPLRVNAPAEIGFLNLTRA